MAIKRKKLILKQFQGADNYELWNQHMLFALQNAMLEIKMIGSQRRQLYQKQYKINNKDRKEQIDQRAGMNQYCGLDNKKFFAMISKTYIDKVQKKLFTVETSTKYNPKIIFETGSRNFTLQNFASRLNVLDKLYQI